MGASITASTVSCTFSHAKAVFQQARMDVTAMMRPPYGEKIQKMMDSQIKR